MTQSKPTSNATFRRSLVVVTALLVLIVAEGADAHRHKAAAQTTAAAAANSHAGNPQAAAQPPIAYPQALILIRSSLSALQQADETGNYSVLYALGSKGFQDGNPPPKLIKTFTPLRAFNLNSILVLDPQFTQAPVLTSNGIMSMAGFFVSGGYHINFQLFYAPENGHWKLFGVSAGVQSLQPAAQGAPAK